MRIEKFYDDLESIKEQGEIFRKMVKLPAINDDVRQLGVGGREDKDHSSHLEYLLPDENDLDGKTRMKTVSIFHIILFFCLKN